jgi:hypothetical protein
MSRGWDRATRIMATVALAAVGALSIGCGPAPGYEPEPRMPTGYANPPPASEYPEPVTSEELAARAQAAPEASTEGEIAVGADTNEYADTDPSALTEFKPALEGHGAWVDDSTYGTVWVPSQTEVGSDFVPYTTAGHWTYAEDTSWVWVSDYSWGWAPFHYGRWVHVSHHGWAWIPGRTYSGAWVVWRTGPGYDYVGWAPAGPDWYWYNGYAVGWTFGWAPYYSYCHHDHLYDHHFGGHLVRSGDPRAREHEGRTRPYVAAAPVVGGGGGGRVAATPTVGGAGAGGRIAASPRVGPRPAELGIRADHVSPPPGDNAGLARAKALASPTTAMAHGAAPPATVPRRRDPETVATAPAMRGEFGRAPAGSNRFEAAARAPQYQGVAPVPPRPSSSPSSSAAYDARSSSRSFGTSSTPSVATPTPAPSFRTPPSASFSQQQPSARSAPTPTPSYRSNPPSFSQSTPSRSAPSFSQPSPSFRSPPPSVRSTPSFSAPAARSAPAVRSAPTPSRPSTPSRPAAPAARSRR